MKKKFTPPLLWAIICRGVGIALWSRLLYPRPRLNRRLVVQPELVKTQIPDHPPAFKFALQLVFQMLSSVLWHLTRKPSQYARSTLNPYLTITLMFLTTVLKHSPTSEILERSIPWKGFLIMSESRFLRQTVQGQRQTVALSNVLERLYSQRMMVRKVLSRYVLYISSSVHSIHC